MEQKYLKLLEYNLWAYERLIDCVQSNRIDHNDILRFISHGYNAEMIWLNRVLSKEESPEVWQMYSLDRCLNLLKDSNAQWRQMLEDTSAFDKRVSYENSKGDSFESSFDEIFTHVINHGTHHRGQVSLIIRELGFTPPPTDMIFFTRTKRK